MSSAKILPILYRLLDNTRAKKPVRKVVLGVVRFFLGGVRFFALLGFRGTSAVSS